MKLSFFYQQSTQIKVIVTSSASRRKNSIVELSVLPLQTNEIINLDELYEEYLTDVYGKSKGFP